MTTSKIIVPVIDFKSNKLVERSKPNKPSVEEMLTSFDKKRHGGEAMTLEPIGAELL